MNYGQLIDHDGIKQTPWITLPNGDEICYLVSFDPKDMRFVLITGFGFDKERGDMKQSELTRVLNEMRV